MRAWARYTVKAVVGAALLAALPLSVQKKGEEGNWYPFKDKEIRCLIHPGSADYLSDGFKAGFSYETLVRFARGQYGEPDIHIEKDLDSAFTALLCDSADIVVLHLGGMEADSLAEGLAAIPFGDDFRWVVKTDREEVRAVQRWLDGFGQTTAYDSLMHRFFNGYNPYRKTPRDEKIISPYDDLLKKYDIYEIEI